MALKLGEPSRMSELNTGVNRIRDAGYNQEKHGKQGN
jgi:hypothetical protein